MDIRRADLLLAQLVDRDLVGALLELVFLLCTGPIGLFMRRQEEAKVLLCKDADGERIHLDLV